MVIEKIILSLNVDRKSLETEFLIAPHWRQMSIENTVSSDYDQVWFSIAAYPVLIKREAVPSILSLFFVMSSKDLCKLYNESQS